jgi:hypothetical protein
MKYNYLFYGVLSLLSLSACGGKTDDKTDTQTPATTTEPAQPAADPMLAVKHQSIQVLNQYFADLGAEQIDGKKYFAPEVKEFFSSQNLSPEKVEQSLKQGFAKMDERKISLDTNSLVINAVPEGYEVVFNGTSEYVEAATKKRVSGDMRNRVLFNKDFKMISYTKAPDADARLTQALAESEFMQNLSKSLGNPAALNQLIDPEKGLLCIFRRGVFDNAEVKKNAKEIPVEILTTLKDVKCTEIQQKTLPSFDCDKGFSEKGCFLAAVTSFKRGTEVAEMREATRDVSMKYKPMQTQSLKSVEGLVTHEWLITEQNIALGFGKINGKWCLLCVDLSKYNCEA